MEGVRQQMGDTLEVIDRAFLTSKEDLHRMSELLLVFEEDLPAASAGGDRLLQGFVGVDGGDGNFVERHLGIHGRGGESGGALGTETTGIDRILLVATCNHLPVVHQDGRADLKMGILRVGTGGRHLGVAQQLAQVVGQFLATFIHAHLGFQCNRLHTMQSKTPQI